MKVFAFVICLALFVGAFFLFGYAFAVPEPFHIVLFASGLVAIAISLIIPFHLLEKLD
ncbi:hypothetical protein GCM10027515_17030 [Schumannella luteola]|uniref:ABC-type antimicrobial peptide transport system permease subunit n=1 Tax=Schumannella luteola TaxID=472059 RepID=A0A852YKG2_9MICO|nr:hypothetical protein [Schumannella luteola]NYH00498.1 ABC-type antimicrobial peptide transport system permease subunit [Schumannella luteola]